jgi:hypothetical protein
MRYKGFFIDVIGGTILISTRAYIAIDTGESAHTSMMYYNGVPQDNTFATDRLKRRTKTHSYHRTTFLSR